MKHFLLITSLLLSITAFAEDTTTETEVELNNQNKTLTLPSLGSSDDASERRNKLAEDLVQQGGEEEWQSMRVTIPSFPDGSRGRSQSIMDLQQETYLNLEDTNLLAKCASYYNHNNGVLTPGHAFFYIIKKENKLFAIPGIVYKEDNLFVREQTLRASLPLYKVIEMEGNPEGSVTQRKKHLAWFPAIGPNHEITFPSLEVLKERYFSDISSLSEEEKKRNEEKNSFDTWVLGKFSYTDNVYWTCNIWFD